MPQIKAWFKAKKTLHNRRKVYYEDVYGYKNSEEDLEGVHILDSESDSGSEILRRQATAGLSSHGGEQPEDNNEDNEQVIQAVDRDTVIMIDDSDSEESFVADLRKHAAQGVDNRHIQKISARDGTDTALLADLYLTAQPPRTSNYVSDGILTKTNRRAQQFTKQSPLGPKKALKPELKYHEVVKTTEETGDRIVREAPNQPADAILDMRFQREHSWDPSQGSDYVYSEDEASDRSTNTDAELECIPETEDDGSLSEDSEDDVIHEGMTQDEDIHNEEYRTSEPRHHNDKVIELDESNPNEADCQMTQPVTRDLDHSHSPGSDDFDHYRNGESCTPSEPEEIISPQKHKRFGMFAASPLPNIESVADSNHTRPPHRLRDLIEKRRIEREQKETTKKRGRYNLRPRRQPAENDDKGLLVAKYSEANGLDDDTGSDSEEPRRPRRLTRSMTTNKPARKPIPRSRAARKTAWVAMGIIPNDEH